MKTKKNLCLVLMFAMGAFILSQCKKTEDPAPVFHPAETNLDSVKTLFTGTWKFQSVTFIHDSISATTSNCAKSQIANAGFPNDDWMLADEQNITFKSATAVSYFNICTTGTVALAVKAVENTDGTVNVDFTDPKDVFIPQKFIVNVADITTTHFKAYLVNGYDYTVIYTFTRE